MAQTDVEQEAPREASTMPDRTDAMPERDRWAPLKRRWPALLLVPVVLFFVAFGGSRLLSRGEVLTGVRVGPLDDGLALGGMDRDAAVGAISELSSRLTREPVVVTHAGRRLEVAPADLGFVVDEAAIVDAAMSAGRQGGLGSQIQSWVDGSGVQIDVVGQLDPTKLGPLFDQWEKEVLAQPTFEGALKADNGEVVLSEPRPGRAITRDAMEQALLMQLLAPSRAPIELLHHEAPPTRTAESWQAAQKAAQALLSAPVTLVGELPPPEEDEDGKKKRKQDEEQAPRTEDFVFTPSDLAPALRSRLVEPSGAEVMLDAEALKPALAQARKKLERPPVDARFEVSKRDEVSIVPSRDGRVIDPAQVATALIAAAQRPDREATFPIEVGAQPEMTTDKAQALNIQGLVSKFTTSHACCQKRVKNIHRMADLIDGVLLKPGERFSINEHVGERRASKGFYPAPTIVHGEMKDTVGGGVSQFATTFYNAFFHGGYAIIERQPHSYYFRRYPMGHEATLSFPKPDVIVRNDTKSGLLIKTEYGGTYIRVKLYGDNEGRKVRRKVSKIYDVTDPPIEYIADDDLEPDEEKVKVRGKVGWAVTVSRVLEYADGETKKQTRKVIYNPRVRKIRVHSCKIPKGEEGYTGLSCPEPEEEEDEDEDEDAPTDDEPKETPTKKKPPKKKGDDEPFDPLDVAPPEGPGTGEDGPD